jgi:hypothetical protein
MRHWVVLVLFLFALGTLRVVACGGDGSCVDDENCDDGNPCTEDRCISYDPDAPLCEVVQRCSHSQVADGTSCGSGKVCADGECGENRCEGVVCDDDNACTDDECNYVDGTCYFPSVVCDDRNECTYDTCDPADGCIFTPDQGKDGTECFNDLRSPPFGVCEAGVCVAPCDPTSEQLLRCPIGPLEHLFCCPGSDTCRDDCDVSCVANVCPCDELGIRAAIQAGGSDPYTFDCDGPTTVLTLDEIHIDNDVILDGEGNLTVDASHHHRVFAVGELATVELRGFTVTGGRVVGQFGGGIANGGELTLVNSTVRDSAAVSEPEPCGGDPCTDGRAGGIWNGGAGALTLVSSTVSGNTADSGGGIFQSGAALMLTNSTVSGNAASQGGGIYSDGSGPVTLTNSTVSGNSAVSGSAILLSEVDPFASMTTTATLIDGACAQQGEVTWTSNGYNIESPGDTCGFDHGTDLVNITEGQLELGELADNGGPTMTHALGAGSVAIDHIPAVDCEVDKDQRGQPRPETGGTMCDVGAFEVQPPAAESCTQSGGTVSTGLCCQAVESFPNICAIGACGCAPDASHEVAVCICPTNTCFDGESCVAQ